MKRGALEVKYPTIPVGDPDEISKAKQWGVTFRFLEVLRAIYKHGEMISRAARSNGYSVQYARNTIWRIRKAGLEEDIRATLKPYNITEGDKEFYEKVLSRIKNDDTFGLKLYAELRGFIQQRQPQVANQTNVQVNAFMVDKVVGDKKEDNG